MLFRETGKEGNKTVRFVRTFYCSEAKGARQKTLGKIKKSEVSSPFSYDELEKKLLENEATQDEILEVKAWFETMQKQAELNSLESEKQRLVSFLTMASKNLR